jgi:hypothetical protein
MDYQENYLYYDPLGCFGGILHGLELVFRAILAILAISGSSPAEPCHL